jgi:16S rRNA processing protein RimM
MEPTAVSTSSTEDGPGDSVRTVAADRLVVLGRVVGSHGLRGQLRVRGVDEDSTNLMRVPRLLLGRTEEDPKAKEYAVASVAAGRPREVRFALVGIEDRDAADALRGHAVLVRAADLERLPPGEFYEYQLVGCRVEDLEGRAIGVVRGIWETGASDVLVVESADGTEHLIPAADEIMQEVDIEERRIVIDAVPGLLDPE